MFLIEQMLEAQSTKVITRHNIRSTSETRHKKKPGQLTFQLKLNKMKIQSKNTVFTSEVNLKAKM